jgi:5-methyltetrahydropteroyltriglutamate--homocysteine methyltransferase
MSQNTPSFPAATILGYPRIGANRELKKALEANWAGKISTDELEKQAADVAEQTFSRLEELGLSRTDSSIPADFALYDHVLDTLVELGALPERFADLRGEDGRVSLDASFVLARGDKGRAPLEMTKYFDSNYHYLVPEIGPSTAFSGQGGRIVRLTAQAVEGGTQVRPVLVGPLTLLLLAKPEDGAEGFNPIDRLDDVVAAYKDLLTALGEAGAQWVQLDEPVLVTEEGSAHLRTGGLAEKVYRELSQTAPALFVTTGYGTAGSTRTPGEGLTVLAAAGVKAVHADLVKGAALPADIADKVAPATFVAGIVDGRNIWRSNLEESLTTLEAFTASGRTISVATSTSLIHVPHTVSVEKNLPEHLPEWLAFADEKVAEVLTLAKGLAEGRAAIATELNEASVVAVRRRAFEGTRRESVRKRTEALTKNDFTRAPEGERTRAQRERLGLPLLPTTTIGSFPQTSEVRVARADHKAGRITDEQYTDFLKAEIERVIRFQEDLGLDVLVHGEAERNDMVQYFAENFDGFAATEFGWVQSYGSRCTRPSILWGDVSREKPFTVEWISHAQSLTNKPVKGMLTGPVTILAWSFVRNDQPLSDTAQQVALALRDEITDLENAGTSIIQVDEPALRELLPLRDADKQAYLDWSVAAFRLATAGAATDTQIHTHLCYSEFGEVISAIDGLDADVTSIEAARSRLEVVADIDSFGFSRGIGPGVYDIHSPRVPSVEETTDLLRTAVASIEASNVWVNPDCGLKTRAYPETEASLKALVAAAKTVREEVSA